MARVLLVDDNPTNQNLASRMLSKIGVEADLASDGSEALALVEQNNYDLVFMDWQMPGMNGEEATQHIRKSEKHKDLIIIAITGHALPGDQEHLKKVGFDDFLPKPIRMDDYRATLERWMKA